MSLDTRECAWAHVKVKVLGRTLAGIRGFEYNKQVTKEAIYAAGRKPIDIQTGNESFSGNIKLLKYELDLLNDAARQAGFADLLEVPHEVIAITVTYKKGQADPMRTTTVVGAAFTEMPHSMEQAALMTEITLPFVAMDVVVR
ncbi:MAG TPA: hypothetical protein PKD90_08615 [Phnomibacter sp.]|nr:hypothetical protein [Phnomibacter sp.]